MTTEQFGVDPAAYDAARTMILDAAADVFQRQGFDRSTIDDIADAIGATKGRVYYYFRSKFDIYLAVYEEGMRKVCEAVEPLSTGPGTGRDRLVAMSVAHAENLMIDLRYHNTIHQGIPGHGTSALKQRQRDELDALNRIRDEYEQMFRKVVADGMADSSLRIEDPKLATRVLLSSLNAIDTWFQPRPGQSVEQIHDLAQRIAHLLINGLTSQKSR
ncbi:AcrR family transcriptional regulator [Rhodococcus percolatus]|uniref:TetR/AcrR family transcriptional regulator n=1 Tax=Rhodococcus opacus TaxID=37919 RepID=UPI0015F8F484|nr:TetR/AcrR family transcriptional regulator [Rhodococcus opacus]MBA8964501.1 AcrR family transcriptional regulator [Rhodococcus opacus]MBP2207536.1 AcrR family transcriptional regulator [Rhodococcus opacus]